MDTPDGILVEQQRCLQVDHLDDVAPRLEGVLGGLPPRRDLGHEVLKGLNLLPGQGFSLQTQDQGIPFLLKRGDAPLEA